MDAHRHVAPVEQGEEVGLAVTACGNQFTIDDARFCRGIDTDRCNILHPGLCYDGVTATLMRRYSRASNCFVPEHLLCQYTGNPELPRPNPLMYACFLHCN